MMRSGMGAVISSWSSRNQKIPVPVGWGLALIAYSVLLYGGVVSGRAVVWITDSAWTLAALIAAVATWRTSRRLAGKRGTAWALFAAACGSWFAGQLIWDWNQLVRHIDVPFPSVADYGFVAFGPLVVAGLYYLRATQTARKLTPQRVANLALVVCSAALVLVALLLEPLGQTQQSPYLVAVAIISACSFTMAFVVAIYLIWSYRWSVDLLPLVLVAAGLALHAVASLIYANNLIVGGYGPGSLVNLAWVAAFGFQHWAASEEIQAEARRHAQPAVRWEGQGWIEALVPSFLLLYIAATAIAFADYLSPRAIMVNAALLAVFAALLACREAWLYSRGLHLQARLQSSNVDLETAREQLRRTADELMELERNRRFAARAGGVGLWDWDLRTQQVDYSPEWKRQLGYEEYELTKDPREWRSRVHPDDVDAVMSAVQSYLRQPSGEYAAEMRMRHRDGSYRWILARATVHLDKHGTPVRMLGVHMDITERKQMEMALRESEARYRELAAELEQRVAERMADLQDAYREAQSFAYAVAHDLKAPLRAIDSFSHLLYESTLPRLTEAERGYIERVRRSAIHMASLIEGLLAYSRMEHREVSLASIPLLGVVLELLEERREEITARGVRLECVVPQALCVRADREGLAIVLRNLLDNALKFTSDIAEPRIEIGARRESPFAVIWVRDNGIGFDQVYHDKIFEIFQRLHRVHEYEGTGIGLALSRKAMQRMRGRIWAESAPGAGATFYVELPLSPTDRSASPPERISAYRPAPSAERTSE